MSETVIRFAWALFTIALTSKSFFSTALLSRFQVKRVPLDFLYDIFLLNLTFEAAQRIFKSSPS